jgi:protoporphyrinogen oxidase
MAGKDNKRIAIIGAGITGLSAAFQLKKLGFQITVFEASSRPGGVIRTFRDKNGLLNVDEYTFRDYTKLKQFFKELNLEGRKLYSNRMLKVATLQI